MATPYRHERRLWAWSRMFRFGLGLFFMLALPFAGVPSQAATSRAAGEFILTYWETEDGLPENSATAMVQTPDGYLWFGTFNGLIRFDGVQFTVFDPSNTPEIPNAEVANVYLDRRGNLWCSTRKGLARLSQGEWKRFAIEEGWTSDWARTFAEDREGRLYVTAFDGRIFQLQGDRFAEFPPPPGNRRDGYFGHVDNDGFFWAAQNRFTGYWDGSTWVRVFPDLGEEETEFGAGPARDGNLWVVHRDTIRKWGRAGMVSEFKITEPISKFWSLVEGRTGDLWICSYFDGVYHVRTNGAVTHYTTTNGLPHDSMRFVFEDGENNYWLGTSGGGLLRVKPRTFYSFGSRIGLPEPIAKSLIVRTNGEVFVGTHRKGLARFNARLPAPVAESFQDRSPGYVQSLLEDSKGRLWIGSHGDGLHLFENDASQRVLDEASSGEDVAALFEDSRGRLWIAFDARVLLHEEDSFRAVGSNTGTNDLRDVHAFEEEPATGAILAANEWGVYRLEGGTFRELKDEKGASIEQVNCIKALPDGTIWFGTANRGLLRYRSGVLAAVAEAQGFTVRAISSIVDDAVSHWWLGSNRGIVRVDPKRLEASANGGTGQLEYQLFTASDGLDSVECASGFQPTAVRAADGTLWFATLKGVAMTDPRRVRINRRPPPILIESASYVDARRTQHELPVRENKNFRLPAGSSQLNVDFTGLSFTAPEKVKFSYRLHRDTELMASEELTRRSVSFNMLPPGNYQLRITGANNDGIWNPQEAVLAFTVLPYFWQTVSFRLGAAALLTLLFGASFWRASDRRVRIQREKFEQQRALAEEKARLASVLEGTSDLVGFATLKGKVLYINPAGRKLLGLGPDEDVTALDIREFYPVEAINLLRRTALPAAIRKGTWSGESVMLPRGGGEILTSQVLLAHQDELGEIHFISAIVRDITDSRKMEETLRHSQKMEALGTLASGIAHDFNNVLSAIIGNIDLARADVGPDHHAVESLNEVRKASIRARDLVSQILAFGRQQVHDRKVIALGSTVTDAARLLRATLPAGIELVTKLSEDAPNVSADSSQMHQVILNLCTNAWHAMDEKGGRIEVCLDRAQVTEENATTELHPGVYARLTVRDNGCGMDAETLDRIFEPFFTTKTRGRGTGLGLAVVHGIVKNHDGCILVRSELGTGTTFEVFLPSTSEKVEPIAADTERSGAPGGQGERILYLDDEAPLVLLATRALQRTGYQVTGCTVPDEAINVFRQRPSEYDVVITDFNMPGMSGLEFAEAVLKIRSDIPVLLTSGYLSDELKANARAAGVAALIYKPNTITELREVIHQWLGERRAGKSPRESIPGEKA